MVWMLILKSLYFFLPAYLANLTPPLLKKVPFLNYSISEKYFGKNKTWRGLTVAILVGTLVFWMQKISYTNGFTKLALIDYNGFSVLFGFLLGTGAILGDLIESYFKRKIGIKPGESWKPYDQLDFVIGALFLSFFVYVPKAEVVLILLIVSPLLHILFNLLGYWLKINKGRW